MLKRIFHSMLFASNLCLFMLFPLLVSAAGTSASVISFNVQQGKLTTNITHQPLSEVLQQISLQAGLVSSVMTAADHNISMQLIDVPLEDALKQLLRGTNYVFFYKKQEQGYTVSGVNVLANGEAGDLSLPDATTASSVSNDTAVKDKESNPEYVRQQKIEAIQVHKLRRERGLPPIFISQNKMPPAKDR